jgi:cytosine deaminase
MVDWILKNCKVDGESELVDVALDDGLVLTREPALSYTGKEEIDLKGRVLIPGFVDPHLHLDIALMNDMDRPGRPEPFRSILGLNESLERRRKAFTRQDIERRAGMAMEMASRHGVTAMRAQCHVDTEVGLKHVEALQAVKERYADRVDLQIVGFPQQGLLRDPRTPDLFREGFKCGLDVMGCVANTDLTPDGVIDIAGHTDMAFKLAMEHDVDLDAHVDLGIPRKIGYDDFEVVYLARKAIEVGYQSRVTAGHLCALGSADPAVADQVIELLLEADISVISQPDLYRLGREDVVHVRRGLTRVAALLAAGVNVTYASNNVRDALRPVGNFDPLEEALILSYGAHMDTVEQLEALMHMGTYGGAEAIGLEGYGLEPGCKADLVVLDAPSLSAAIVGQVEKNYVFKGGRLMASSHTVSERYS